MYDQAGGAREMAHEAYLLARFEPLLGWPTVEQPLFDYAASKNVG
jgi:hypothetical protein